MAFVNLVTVAASFIPHMAAKDSPSLRRNPFRFLLRERRAGSAARVQG